MQSAVGGHECRMRSHLSGARFANDPNAQQQPRSAVASRRLSLDAVRGADTYRRLYFRSSSSFSCRKARRPWRVRAANPVLRCCCVAVCALRSHQPNNDSVSPQPPRSPASVPRLTAGDHYRAALRRCAATPVNPYTAAPLGAAPFDPYSPSGSAAYQFWSTTPPSNTAGVFRAAAGVAVWRDQPAVAARRIVPHVGPPPASPYATTSAAVPLSQRHRRRSSTLRSRSGSSRTCGCGTPMWPAATTTTTWASTTPKWRSRSPCPIS